MPRAIQWNNWIAKGKKKKKTGLLHHYKKLPIQNGSYLQIASNLEKENRAGGIWLSDFRLYYRATLSKGILLTKPRNTDERAGQEAQK